MAMRWAMIFRWKMLEGVGLNPWDRPDAQIIPPITLFPKMVRPEWWWHNWRTEIPLRVRTALYILRNGDDL